jgi:tetratricopeptide (TPR) repeat protein
MKVLTGMAKPGRNDPCHCGSGKKYKKCCQPKDETAKRQLIAQDQAAREARAAARRMQERAAKAEFLERFADAKAVDDELEQLTAASNAAVNLVKAGKLEEAETAARDLLERFPHVHDGWDRLGMVHEARGEKKQAADCYRKAIEIIRAQPESYDPEFADVFVALVDKLDPPAARPTTE